MTKDELERRLSECIADDFLRFVDIQDTTIIVREKTPSGAANIALGVKGLALGLFLRQCRVPFRRTKDIGDGIIFLINGRSAHLCVVEIKPVVGRVSDIEKIKRQLVGSSINALSFAAALGVSVAEIRCLVAVKADRIGGAAADEERPDFDQIAMRKVQIGAEVDPLEVEWNRRLFRFEGRDDAIPIQIIQRDAEGNATASL